MKYKIRTISFFHFILMIFIILLFIITFLTTFFGIKDSIFAYFISASICIITYLIAYKLTYGEAQVILTKKKLEFFWIKKPLLTYQKNQSINLEDIESWQYRNEFQYSYFKIFNPSNIITITRLAHWSSKKDGFDNFRFAFKKRIENINKKRKEIIIHEAKIEWQKEIPKQIRDKEKDFYDSSFSKFLFYTYIIFGIIGATYVYNNWNTGKTNIGIIIFGIIGCLFYINNYKKRNNNIY